MKVYKEVNIEEAEINDLIVREMYSKEREEFYRYGNDNYSFPEYDSWRREKYENISKNK